MDQQELLQKPELSEAVVGVVHRLSSLEPVHTYSDVSSLYTQRNTVKRQAQNVVFIFYFFRQTFAMIKLFRYR